MPSLAAGITPVTSPVKRGVVIACLRIFSGTSRMDLPIFQIDAFTLKNPSALSGNPAAVVPLNDWLDDRQMQDIAAENNLSETTFFVKQDDDSYHLRWFTPTSEVDLCGHATLATAHVIHQILGDEREQLPMTCQAGNISVSVLRKKSPVRYRLEFPQRAPEAVTGKRLLNKISKILNTDVQELHQSRDLIAVLKDEAAVRDCNPDFAALGDLDCFALAITAPAEHGRIDFVSRFFAPRQGINEDPVTGSSFCSLTPLWAEKLGKTRLQARQISQRGGQLSLDMKGDTVRITGSTYHYMQGVIRIPD